MNLLHHGMILRRKLESQLMLPCWQAVAACLWGLVCFALEMSTAAVLWVPLKWCHDGAQTCVSTGLAHGAQILGEVQWCCRPGVGMGHRQIQTPRACASLPHQKHPRGWRGSGWDGSNSPRWAEARGERQQFYSTCSSWVDGTTCTSFTPCSLHIINVFSLFKQLPIFSVQVPHFQNLQFHNTIPNDMISY